MSAHERLQDIVIASRIEPWNNEVDKEMFELFLVLEKIFVGNSL